jgi:hypothetical protein
MSSTDFSLVDRYSTECVLTTGAGMVFGPPITVSTYAAFFVKK